MSDQQALLDTSCFQGVPLKGRYRSQDRPRDKLLLPLLERAARYDRAAGYFSSTSLAAAADGLEPFITAGGTIRLVVNHQLADDDVAAVQRGLDLREAVRRHLAKEGLAPPPEEEWQPPRVRLLATLVALGQLELRVAVACDDQGQPIPGRLAQRIHHAKFGLLVDRCEPPCRVAFEGSNNESKPGWLDNYETCDAFMSWKAHIWEEYGRGIEADFLDHWDGPPPPGWTVLDLPDAVRQGLLAKADPDLARQALEAQGREAEIDEVIGRILAARGDTAGEAEDPLAGIRGLLDAPRATAGVGLATVTIVPWLHQYDVARKVIGAWPCSRLFADEVGLGKTIEVGLVLRELLVAGAIDSALLLVPASVLSQWQSELWEKFTLAVPVLRGATLEWPESARPAGQEVERITGNRWDAAPVMLASSHLGRRRDQQRHLVERRWDLVVVDEAHHARRRGADQRKDEPNALLRLLRDMDRQGCWTGLVLASATPMQMHAHEAYDLLAPLSLPGPHPEHPDDPSWRDSGAPGFVRYYTQLAIEDAGARDWRHLIGMARSHFAAFPGHNPHLAAALDDEVAAGRLGRGDARKILRFHEAISDRTFRRLAGAGLEWLDAWLAEHTPMRTLVHRNTRHLLRAYQASGEIPADVVIPTRDVRDETVTFDDAEQKLYDRIETWIRNQYAASQRAAAAGDRQARALGFIMTVYRRRLTSSFYAIEQSLRRRRDAIVDQREGLIDLTRLLDDDDRATAEDVADGLEQLIDPTDGDAATIAADMLAAAADEVDELTAFLDDLARRPSYDSKLQRLVDDLVTQLGQGKPDGNERQAIVFTQYADTMDAIRGDLATRWPGRVACYSGRGGEVHDPVTGTWVKTDKATLKTAFAAAEYRLLVGTDAMSEGLNLQTCELLYNLDLPWNFMRVEQRIGRVDRIGGHPTVHIVNLLIAGTVEEQIYRGIGDDFANFEAIVGAAQPVLAQTENAIHAAVFAEGPDRDAMLTQQAQALITAARDAQAAPVNVDTFTADPAHDAWRPAVPLPGEVQDDWLGQLREALTSHPVYGPQFDNRGSGTWGYTDEYGHEWTVTFDRKVADASGGAVGLFVWGHPAFPTPAGC